MCVPGKWIIEIYGTLLVGGVNIPYSVFQFVNDLLTYLRYFQSMVKRKAIIKEGKRLTMSGWQRYWMELWGSSLVYFAPKTLTKGNERKDYKSDPCKYHSISGWLVMIPDSSLMDSCSFQLTDPVQKSVYKFRTSSEDITQIWIRSLQDGALAKTFAVYNTNLISFE